MISRHLVSIIVPAYNSDKFISETLDSVIAQTYPHWECIVIDDGSTDNTKEIVAEYCKKDPRISYRYQENAGPSVARNHGIAHTTGEYILPLDSDDIIADTYLEKAVNRFISHPETTLVYCKIEMFGATNGPYLTPKYKYENLLYANNTITNCSFYKRVDYNKTSGYNPNMRGDMEDWDFWLSLLNSNSIVHCINEPLLFYRQHYQSRSHTSSEKGLHYMKIINNHPEIYSTILPQMFQNSYLNEQPQFQVIHSIYKKIKPLRRQIKKLLITWRNSIHFQK